MMPPVDQIHPSNIALTSQTLPSDYFRIEISTREIDTSTHNIVHYSASADRAGG